jgi:hypothetical protein
VHYLSKPWRSALRPSLFQRHADIMTRQEATGIPNLLVAPRTPPSSNSREIYENGVGDFRGYYEDGAYIASAQSFADSSEIIDEEAGVDPQLAYFDSILARYESLKEQLQQTPPPDAVKKLDQYHPIHVAVLNSYMAKWWIQRMKNSEPLPAQIACMNKKSVLRLLGLITQGSLLKRGSEVGVGASQWAWALLAKLPERGELNNDEIGVIRELGKKAVLVAMGLRNVKSWEEGMQEVEEGFDAGLEEEVEETVDMTNEDEIYLDLDDEADEGDGLEDGEQNAVVNTISNEDPILEVNYSPTVNDNGNTTAAENAGKQIEQELAPGDIPISTENLADAQARILSLLNEKVPEYPVNIEAEVPAAEKSPETSSPSWNTIATVDMIITIAGEIYGQRDLLEFRTVWEEIM